MKRIAAIAGFLVCAALAVGAFVFAGNDGGGKGKTATVLKTDPTTTTVKHTEPTTTTTQVASDAPTTTTVTTVDEVVFHPQEQPELDGYEARKVFVGVSPSVVRTGRDVEIQLRGFSPNHLVTITVSYGKITTPPVPPLVFPVTTDNKGRAKFKIPAPLITGSYLVSADQTNPTRSAGAALKVVVKQ